MILDMQSERGITLTSLIVYIIGITVVIGIIAMLSTYFYENIAIVKESGENSEIYTAFNMFFLGDIKKEKITISECTGNKIVFSNGITYEYTNGFLYRNGIKILDQIEILNFSVKKDSSGQKDIITVKIAISGHTTFIRSTDYVIRYW